MKNITGYALMLKFGEIDDRVIRGITVEGGRGIIKVLKNDPPSFIEVKGRMIATNTIMQLIPVYREDSGEETVEKIERWDDQPHFAGKTDKIGKI
jgi:hypothetical protein